MKKLSGMVFAALLLSLTGGGVQAAEHMCAKAAKEQARALLMFHLDVEKDKVDIDEDVTVLAPIKNPANKQQSFDVIEVMGFQYKGSYRMRLIYYVLQGEQCVLMGQEILELANL